MRAVDALHEDADCPAAGQAGREHVVLAQAVGLQNWFAGGEHAPGRVVHRCLHATTRDAAECLASGVDGQHSAGLPRRGHAGRDDRRQRERCSRLPPAEQLRQRLTHGRSPRGWAGWPEAPRLRRGPGIPRRSLGRVVHRDSSACTSAWISRGTMAGS